MKKTHRQRAGKTVRVGNKKKRENMHRMRMKQDKQMKKRVQQRQKLQVQGVMQRADLVSKYQNLRGNLLQIFIFRFGNAPELYLTKTIE